MKRIVNERRYAEELLDSKQINVKRPNKDINTIIKYYYEENPKITKQELIGKVNEFLLEATQDELAVKRWQVTVKDLVSNFMGYAPKFKGLSCVEYVTITRHELDMIMDLDDYELEYIAFAMLVYLKIKNAISGRLDNIYVPNDEPDVRLIKKISGLRLTVKQTALKIKELQDRGYTLNGIGRTVCSKLAYVDYDSEDGLVIEDFTIGNINLYYRSIVEGGRLIYCQECGKLVLVQGNKGQYCKKCAKDKYLESTKETMRKKRKS